MSKEVRGPSGAAEGARSATGAAPEGGRRGAGRWSARRKAGVVLELLRGGDLEQLSRKHAVTAATLSEWRDTCLAAMEVGLRSRETAVEDEENRRLKAVVAEQALDAELLRQKIRQLEGGLPLARRRWRP